MKVVKRDGSSKELKPEKILKVVKASGLSDTQAKKLVADVVDWIEKNHEQEISSLRIRDRVIVELQKIDKYAADFYIWYEKGKDRQYH